MGTMQRKQEPVEGTGEVRTGVGRVSKERQREEYTEQSDEKGNSQRERPEHPQRSRNMQRSWVSKPK